MLDPRATGLLLLASLGCGGPTAEAPPESCTAREALVLLSDYSSTFVGAIDTTRAELWSAAEFGRDPQLRTSGGEAFLVARYDQGTVFRLNPACGFATEQIGVNRIKGENPQDVALAPDGSLWVPKLNVPELTVRRPDGRLESIDLSGYDDDGNPQAASILRVDHPGGSSMYVALERLDDDDWPKSKLPSLLVRFDAATLQEQGRFTLRGRNPFGLLGEANGHIVLAAPGSFDADDEPDAGIELFDPRTDSSRLLVAETALGGSVVEVAIDGRCGVAIVAGPEVDVNPTWIVSFDAETGALGPRLMEPTAGYDLQGLAWSNGSLYVGDRRRHGANYRIHRFTRSTDGCILQPSDPIPVPQQPVALRKAKAAL